MNNDINEKIVHAAPVPPFVRFVASAVPMVFDNSLSYYEALCALWKWMQDNLVNVINNNASVTEHYIELTNDLKEFVEDYFANLDVQDEINNKLDQMAEDGTLQEIITTYIQANVAWTFDTVTDMKSATNLVAGSYAQTLGFHSLNDAGGAIYYITDSGTANEHDVIAVGDLYGVIVKESLMTPEQFGAYGDNSHDDTEALQSTLDTSDNIKFGNSKTYLVSDKLTASTSLRIDGNNSKVYGDLNTIPLLEISSTENYITNLTFEGGIDTAGLLFTSANSNAIVEKCKFLSLGLYGVSQAKIVRNCYFYNCARKTGDTNGQGMIYAGKDYVVYEGNEFYALDGDGLDHCIYAGGSQHHDIQILNNKCYALEGCTQGPLLALYPSTEVEDEHYHYNCIVKGNIFDYAKGASSRAGIAISCQDSIISENIFYGNGTSVASAYLVVSLRNSIANNKFIGGYINAEDCRNTDFSGNTLKNCNSLSLRGQDNTKLVGFNIHNNKFINTNILQAVSRHCSGIIIDSNYFGEYSGSAINMNQYGISSSNVKITNNIIENQSEYGILCRYVTNVEIIGNLITNKNSSYTTNRALSLYYQTDYTGSTVANNHIEGTFYEGYGNTSILMIRTGGKWCNNTGGELGNGMLTAYPENGTTTVANHTPYYPGELLNLSGVIYIAKGVTNASDWVQLSN